MNKFLAFFLILIFSCSYNKQSNTNYIGYLVSNDSINIPFNFDYKKSGISINNGDELVFLRLNNSLKDSLRFESPFFEEYINFIINGDSLNGYLYNQSLSRKIPFYAIPGMERFGNNFIALRI